MCLTWICWTRAFLPQSSFPCRIFKSWQVDQIPGERTQQTSKKNPLLRRVRRKPKRNGWLYCLLLLLLLLLLLRLLFNTKNPPFFSSLICCCCCYFCSVLKSPFSLPLILNTYFLFFPSFLPFLLLLSSFFIYLWFVFFFLVFTLFFLHPWGKRSREGCEPRYEGGTRIIWVTKDIEVFWHWGKKKMFVERLEVGRRSKGKKKKKKRRRIRERKNGKKEREKGMNG